MILRNDDLVSVITPAHNAGKYLADTIRSVQQQTYENWEMIIVDDFSKDDTALIAKSFADKDERIKLVKNQQNMGVAATRNTAIKCARGRFIAFLDSDDMWSPIKLEHHIRFMKENTCALSYTAYQKMDAKMEELGKIVNVPHQMTYDDIFSNTAIACLTVIVDRDMTGMFQMPLLDHTEDQCTWQEILSRGFRAYGLNENLAFYRVGTNSLTSDKIKAAKGQWHTYRTFYHFNLCKSIYYFSKYAFNAVKRYLK